MSFFLITGLLMVGLLNYASDPYSIFQFPRIDGFNTNKIGFTKHLRLTKAKLIAKRKPDALIIGTSRTGFGLSPDHPGFEDSSTFNLGIADMSMFEAVQYLQHANNIRKLKKVVFAIDFRLFTNPYPNPSFSKSRLATKGTRNLQYWNAWLDDHFSALFTHDSLMSSLRMIRYQTWGKTNLLENGFWLRDQSKFDPYKAFRVYTTNTIKRIQVFKKNNSQAKEDTPNPLEEYRDFVRYCYQHNIQLYLLISPSHAWHWETLRATDVWPTFQYFKQQLILINEEEAKQNNQRVYPLWDFSGYNYFSTEQAPLAADNTIESKWFWETIHYKKKLGDRILNKLFGLNSDYIDTLPFGVRLTIANLASHEIQMTQDHIDFEASHPNEIQIIQHLIKQTNP